MVASGAQAKEVEATLRRVLDAYDAPQAVVMVSYTSVTVSSVAEDSAEATTAVEVVRRWDPGYHRLVAATDLAAADSYIGHADWLLFDAKPPPQMTGALPGGNALSFDWRLLAGRAWPLPWMLSGGLTAANLAEAVGISGARVVDVSSGVESRPGQKDPQKIAAFLAEAKRLSAD